MSPDVRPWITFGVALILFLLVLAAVRIYLAGVERRRRRTTGHLVRLLGGAALELGAEAVDDIRVPHLKSRPPDPPYGLALAPTDDGGYFPIFEAPVSGAVFVEAWPVGSPYPPLRVSMGSDVLTVGEPEFELAYIVRSDDPHFARSLLGAEARDLLEAGRKIGSGGRLRLNIDRLRMRLRKEEALSKPQDLVALARVGQGLLERVREAVESREAVQYFDAPASSTEKPACPVCGAAVADERVLCRRCRTPHHRECWEYARGCSMFACGETRFSL